MRLNNRINEILNYFSSELDATDVKISMLIRDESLTNELKYLRIDLKEMVLWYSYSEENLDEIIRFAT